jgi:hypothetical protein
VQYSPRPCIHNGGLANGTLYIGERNSNRKSVGCSESSGSSITHAKAVPVEPPYLIFKRSGAYIGILTMEIYQYGKKTHYSECDFFHGGLMAYFRMKSEPPIYKETASYQSLSKGIIKN